jgi:serine O-acetyltransferase
MQPGNLYPTIVWTKSLRSVGPASGRCSVVCCILGFCPLRLCRVSRAALLSGIPALPQLLGYLNLVLFGLEVAPRCEIGPGIFFPHPSGTVIGSWHIGSNVTIFQGVTLGSQKLDMGFDSSLRPEIGDDVVIGAGAKILGGIRIGSHVTVGANAVVVDSIENGCTVVGIPGRPLRSRRSRLGAPPSPSGSRDLGTRTAREKSMKKTLDLARWTSPWTSPSSSPATTRGACWRNCLIRSIYEHTHGIGV